LKAFLLPALLGDEPQLRNFRGALDGHIDFDLLRLPDRDAPPALLSSMRETARVLVDQVTTRQPSGVVALVGFSFGASLALEVAAQLERLGRTIAFLGILDGAFRTGELKLTRSETLRLCSTPRGLAKLAVHIVKRLDNRARLILAARKLTTVQAPAMQDALLMDYRCKALNSWDPPGCSAPGVVIFSGALGGENRRKWLSLCPNLAVLDVEARHGDFLKGRSLASIVDALSKRSASLDSSARAFEPA
jgi:thioesterase domain-containing protein